MSSSTVRRSARKVVSARTIGRARYGITILMGCGIPLVSLYTSHRAGELLQGASVTFGCMFLAICCTVLALSLSHLADAIADITRSSKRNSWLLAVALDCGIVACELTRAAGHDGGWLAMAFLVGITGASMLLNCWAFLSHGKASKASAARKAK